MSGGRHTSLLASIIFTAAGLLIGGFALVVPIPPPPPYGIMVLLLHPIMLWPGQLCPTESQKRTNVEVFHLLMVGLVLV